MGKLLCLGKSASIAAGAQGTINVAIPRLMRLWRLSLSSDASSQLTPNLRVVSITVGGQQLTFNGSNATIPWLAFINSEGTAWDLTVDFGENLSDVPMATGDAGIVIVVENGEAGAALVSAVAAMMD